MHEVATALTVAFRHIDDPTTSETEREAILEAVVRCMRGEPAETASRVLHHLREAKSHQMTLRGILDRRA